jgi:hypothetical protein
MTAIAFITILPIDIGIVMAAVITAIVTVMATIAIVITNPEPITGKATTITTKGTANSVLNAMYVKITTICINITAMTGKVIHSDTTAKV